MWTPITDSPNEKILADLEKTIRLAIDAEAMSCIVSTDDLATFISRFYRLRSREETCTCRCDVCNNCLNQKY